jgi:hypothetical protein
VNFFIDSASLRIFNRWDNSTILANRTVWEIKQKTLVDMAVDRGCYIDQSQSLNIHMDQPNFGKLTSLHFYAWSKVCTSKRYPKKKKNMMTNITCYIYNGIICSLLAAGLSNDFDTGRSNFICLLWTSDFIAIVGSLHCPVNFDETLPSLQIVVTGCNNFSVLLFLFPV